MTNKDIIEYTRQEGRFQRIVYPKKVRTKKMSQDQADMNMAIIDRVHRMAEALEKRGLTMDDFAKWVGTHPVIKGQKNLFD